MVTIIKKPGENNDAENLLRIQYDSMITQRDGCGALWIVDGKIKTKRVLKVSDYVNVFDEVLKDFAKATFVSVHTRISTGGEGFDNVHFFKPNKFYFAHNGFVSKYSSYSGNYWKDKNKKKEKAIQWSVIWEQQAKLIEMFKDDNRFIWHMKNGKWASFLDIYNELYDCEGCASAIIGFCHPHSYFIEEIKRKWLQIEEDNEKGSKKDSKKDLDSFCDSYQFAHHLPNELDPDIISEAMEKDTFTGLGLLVKDDASKAYLLVKKSCYALSDKKTFASFFSWSPKKRISIKQHETICGVKIELPNREIHFPYADQEIGLGVYPLDLSFIQNQPEA